MHLSEFVKPHGAQAALAKKLNITPVLVSQWATGKRQVPAERCRDIEEATVGAVTAQELRPDVFGKPKSEATNDTAAA